MYELVIEEEVTLTQIENYSEIEKLMLLMSKVMLMKIQVSIELRQI